MFLLCDMMHLYFFESSCFAIKTLFLIWSLFRITTEIKTTYEKFVRFAQNRGEQFYPTAFVTYRISHIYIGHGTLLTHILCPINTLSLKNIEQDEQLFML